MTTPELPPEGGWRPEDFPVLVVVPTTYTSHASIRPDPLLTISDDGWLFLDAGNIRLGLPNEAEWRKLVSMVDRMFNAYHVKAREELRDSADLAR